MYLSKEPLDLTVVYYTCNYLEKENPVFLANTQHFLLKAIGQHPLISVSQKPMDFGQNICLGDIGRSHFNIYKQILIGAKAAKTKHVALAEDDILYSYAHFHTMTPRPSVFLYDMAKLSIFTWSEPPQFSFRTRRTVVNQLIAPRKMLIEAMEERFTRMEQLLKEGWPIERIESKWGDPGRYENLLGITVREVQEEYFGTPSIVFTHPKAYGYEFNHGKRKRLGDIRIIEEANWGRADQIVQLYSKPYYEIGGLHEPTN